MYDPPSSRIDLENRTDSAIYVYYSFRDSLELSKPLFLFEQRMFGGVTEYMSPDYRINAYTFGGIGTLGQTELFSKNKGENIRFFFIKESTMRSFSWKEIVEKQLYEKKKKFSEEELEENRWMVEYP